MIFLNIVTFSPDQKNCHNATGSVDYTNWDCFWDDAANMESCMTHYDYCQKYGGQLETVCKQLKACHWDDAANSKSCMTHYDYCQKYGGHSRRVCKQLKFCNWDMDANECVYEV
jgi:hypothetical protein